MKSQRKFIDSFDDKEEARRWAMIYSVHLANNPKFAGWGVKLERLYEGSKKEEFALFAEPLDE